MKKPARGLSLTIISGGQTGADRAALDWAIEHALPHGGWCPRGRRAEDGAIPRRYRLRETSSDAYQARTRLNVRDSDGTVIFSISPALAGGSSLTLQFCREEGKPWLHLVRQGERDPARALWEFVCRHALGRLNVAGPRASEESGVGEFVRETLDGLLAIAEGAPRK